MGWLALAFVVLPLFDLYLLLRVGDLLGFWPTVALTVATGVFGAWLAKREATRVWRAWRAALEELRAPEQGLVDGALVLAGGALLMTPGVVTDVLGLFLLIPPTRRIVARLVRRQIDRRIAAGQLHVVPLGGDYWMPDDPSKPGVVDTTGESVGEDQKP